VARSPPANGWPILAPRTAFCRPRVQQPGAEPQRQQPFTQISLMPCPQQLLTVRRTPAPRVPPGDIQGDACRERRVVPPRCPCRAPGMALLCALLCRAGFCWVMFLRGSGPFRRRQFFAVRRIGHRPRGVGAPVNRPPRPVPAGSPRSPGVWPDVGRTASRGDLLSSTTANRRTCRRCCRCLNPGRPKRHGGRVLGHCGGTPTPDNGRRPAVVDRPDCGWSLT